MSLYLNVGCGNKRYEGVINIDSAPSEYVDADIRADIRKLPHANDSVDGIIAEHVLEHLPREEWVSTIMEWRRVLRMGGILHVAVPNLDKILHYYLDNRYGMRDYWYANIYGLNRYVGDTHRSGFTQTDLTDLLFSCGFYNLKWLELSPNMEHNIAVKAIKGELLTTIQEVKAYGSVQCN